MITKMQDISCGNVAQCKEVQWFNCRPLLLKPVA